MTLPLPWPEPQVPDENRDNFDTIAQQFPLQDSNLASPNNSTYKQLQTGVGALNAVAAGTYLFGNTPTTGVVGSAVATTLAVQIVSLVASEFAVTGKTTKLHVRASTACNATAPAITYTFGLYPVTVAGGANVLTYTAGAVVAGSTAAIVTPGASAVTTAASSDVTIPADGAYALGIVLSGLQAANSSVAINAALCVRNV